jgi:hypothetical protein
MELVRFVPLYYVAMPWSMIIVTEAPFVSLLVHIVLLLGLGHKLQGEHNL